MPITFIILSAQFTNLRHPAHWSSWKCVFERVILELAMNHLMLFKVKVWGEPSEDKIKTQFSALRHSAKIGLFYFGNFSRKLWIAGSKWTLQASQSTLRLRASNFINFEECCNAAATAVDRMSKSWRNNLEKRRKDRKRKIKAKTFSITKVSSSVFSRRRKTFLQLL